VKEKRRIVLFGNSVILGTVGARLRRCPDVEVTEVAPLPGQEQAVRNLAPDAVLFDVEATDGQRLLCFLEDDPRVVLVGLSPGANRVKVWSCRELRELSMRGLLDVIDSQIGTSPALPGGEERLPRPHPDLTDS
jgi:hypothetical protein